MSLQHTFRRTVRVAWRAVSLVLLSSLISNVLAMKSYAQDPSEYQVKAAFLLNFAKFVEWPNPNGHFVIGIVGDDPFGSELDQMASNTRVNGSRFTIRRLKWNDNLRECQILFISSSERKRLSQILDSVRGGGVLTIGETSQFNESGGIVRFFLANNKVRFQINLQAAEQAHLRVSSKLMALSKTGH